MGIYIMLNMKKNYFTSTSYQLNIKLFVNILSLHICYHLSKHDKGALEKNTNFHENNGFSPIFGQRFQRNILNIYIYFYRKCSFHHFGIKFWKIRKKQRYVNFGVKKLS